MMSGTDDRATAVIREAAAEWLVRLHGGDADRELRVAFTAWLRASPVHVREYLRAEAAWLALQDVTRGDDSDVQALVRQAHANVVDLHADSPVAAAQTARRKRRRVSPAIAAVAALLVVGVFAFLWRDRIGADVYATDVGEMRRVVLADGSAVELNTHTRIRVDLGKRSRDIVLEEGEAFFSVAKDPQRPFRVISGDMLVRAVGTAFNVYRKPGETVVTVVEGKVAVRPRGPAVRVLPADPGDASGTPIELAAGHLLRVTVDADLHAAAPVASAAEIQRATAWRQRRLVFEDESLAAIVAEFNRYNRTQLVVEDPQLATLRISGVFDPDKPQSLVRFLAGSDAVIARELSGNRLLIARGNEIAQ